MCLNRSMDKPKSKKIHLALSVKNLDEVVKDYNKRLGSSPEVFIPNEYALWRTNEVNLSVRVDPSFQPGSLRHLGFEDPSYFIRFFKKHTNFSPETFRKNFK